MLHVYTRHLATCAHSGDNHWRRCHCPKWIRGVLLNGTKIRRSAQTASWENAEKLARKLEADVDPEREKIEASRELPLREAVETFLSDQKARGLGKETQKKYRGFLERQLLGWADSRKIKFLARVSPSDLTKFRTTWSNGETTTHRKHEMLASFFRFCQRNELVGKSPMDALKKPKTPDVVPTDYFLPEEFEKIIAATDKYEFGGGNDCEFRGPRLRAMSLLMRWAGLSILDATKLERAALSRNEEGDNQIFLYRAKTGVPVYVVIPPDVADLLRSVPNSNPLYFFWSGNGDPRSARKAFQRSFWKLFKLANIRREDGSRKRCHPHMFRDTFAVELLLAGNPIDQVSLLLGHSSVKITERHYAPFCKARQQQLTAAVKRSWGARAPKRVASTYSASGPVSPPTTMIQ
jgi:integrase